MHFRRVICADQAKLKRREYDPEWSQESSTLPGMRRPLCLADIRAARTSEPLSASCRFRQTARWRELPG